MIIATFDIRHLTQSTRFAAIIALLGTANSLAFAQSSIDVGDVVIDPPTISTLGFSVPLLGGDINHNATASVTFRRIGATEWREALPLLRVRPETISRETPPEDFGFSRPGEQFAGSIFNLEPDSTYDVQITVSDPDGGSRAQIVQATTRKIPRSRPVTPRTIAVVNSAEFESALLDASPGDVIALASGTYAGRYDLIGRAGTEDNPIVIRGPVAGGEAILDGTGQSVALNISSSDYIHVEHLRIIGVSGIDHYGLRLSGQNIVARSLKIESSNGIDASSDRNRGFYICDNELRGPTVWPIVAVGSNVSEKSWIGIGIRGQGHTVCHNTLSGFGSTLFIGFRGGTNPSHSLAIDLHNNDIAWSADDGIEFDGSLRNVRAWENRVRNALMSMSFSPVWGGPVYAFRNIIYNAASAPFKLNNDPSGVLLYHNTAFRYRETDIRGPYDGNAWPQLGEPANYAANTRIKNNIFVGNDDAIFVRQEMPLLEFDYNGYSPDGAFGFQLNGVLLSFADIASFRAGAGFEENGVVLAQPVFESAPPPSSDYTIFAPALDFQLHGQSSAIDRGTLLPNINDDYAGIAPDLGALELSGKIPVYGVRNLDTMPPAAPTDLIITAP